MGHLLFLSEMGMRVNPEKSTIIFGLRGRSFHKWLRKRLFSKQKQRRVNMGTPSEPLVIPVQDRMAYLGVVVSYQQFEMQTLQRIMKVTNLQKHRLVKVLHSTRGLSLKHRIRVYLACVRSTTMCGLHAIGVTPRGAARLSSVELRHLRAPARSPVHITRERNQLLLARLGVTSSYDYLSKLLKGRIERVDQAKLTELDACRAAPTQAASPAGEGAGSVPDMRSLLYGPECHAQASCQETWYILG